MLFLSFLQHYLLWHYTQALREIFHVWNNFRWFTIHYFSLPALTRTLFSPWKRITEHRERSFNFEDIAGVIIINLLSRLVGFVLRFAIILTGLLALLGLLIGIVFTYLLWLVAPVGILIGVATGVAILFM